MAEMGWGAHVSLGLNFYVFVMFFYFYVIMGRLNFILDGGRKKG